MKEINGKIYELAKANGCCDEWLLKIVKSNIDELLELYRNGMDFNIEHEWISDKLAKELFSPEIRHKHGIYIGENFDGECNNGIYSLKCTKGNMSFERFAVSTIYVFDNSSINVSVSDFSHVFIHVYDTSEVNVTQEDVSKVFIYKHSEESAIDTHGDIKIRNKY